MDNNWLDFKGQVIAITGGRRGIGRELAIAFAKAGAVIAVTSKSADSGSLGEIFSENNWELFYYQADLCDRKQRAGFIPAVIEHFGKIDVLINNAGIQNPSSVADYTPEQWDSEISLMLTAPFELAKQVGEYMCAQGRGKIINLASISSFQGARNIIGYATAKHGIVGLTKCLANEFAPHQVNVNAIAPGLVQQNVRQEFGSEEFPHAADLQKQQLPYLSEPNREQSHLH